MDKKIKDKWIKALRSGRYKQIQGRLHDNGAYCCLGVLCRVQKIPLAKFDGLSIPDEKHQAGLSAKFINTLVRMNDNKLKSFEQIANHIERYY